MIALLLATTLLFSNGRELSVEIATTPEQQERGLSGRRSLAEDSGMLFLFDEPDYHSFCMRGMRFPLDFIWLNKNQIVELTQNVPANSTQTYEPAFPVNAVIEVNAGWVQSHEITVGDTLTPSRSREIAPASEMLH